MRNRLHPWLVLTFSAFAALFFEPFGHGQPTPRSQPTPLQGPCDIYAAAGDPCVAAHSTTRALYAAYSGPLYQVLRQSDGKTLDIGVIKSSGGYADAAAQDSFCADTYCWISIIYDQSPKHNNLTQAPRGGFSGPAMGGFNNLPLADMAPATLHGHKVYGVFIEPGMGLRIDDPRGTAVDDQAEGQYWVINGHHFNSGCCFDYGNAEIDSRDDDNGTMETAFFGDTMPWFHGMPPGPWVMTDQENNLVGCVNEDDSKLCKTLPSITSRFVTAVAKGEPHHWTSMGGDAQHGPLQVMFSGRRVDSSYDPMRKQGAILLGNGGDNSNGSQGTFYEGAVTAAGTFPTDATDQLIQQNVVAAGYAEQPLHLAAGSATRSNGVQTFTPGRSGTVKATFTNTGTVPATGLSVSLKTPEGWQSAADGTAQAGKTFSEPVAPGMSVSVLFDVTAGRKTVNGDLVAEAVWKGGAVSTDAARMKVRSASPVRLNEFRIGSTSSLTDSFIELYNPATEEVDLSNWSIFVRPAQQADASAIKLPAGTRLKAKGFFLLGMANSGLSAPTTRGAKALYLRSVAGMSAGDTVVVGSGQNAESRKIATLGSASSNHTTVWQPLPDGPVITIPAGSTNLPVQSTAGFKVGDKVALGYGATYPAVGSGTERYELATVTAVGKPGLQAYLAADAPIGATTLQVTSIDDISVGDKIRLDIDSLHHGIETVTVKSVGTQAHQTNLTADVPAGTNSLKVRRASGIRSGDKITVGTPATQEIVTVSAVDDEDGQRGAEIRFAPALKQKHGRDEWVVSPGTGLQLSAPLRFAHAANLPFSSRGTGVSFEPATRFAHSSNEPVIALGSGVTLDQPLAHDHDSTEPVRDAVVTTAGYQGRPVPDQWFGGPELSTNYLQFGRVITTHEGSLVLRDASGIVVDSLNYGGLVDPWAAKGYQAESGGDHRGCFAPAPTPTIGFGPPASLPHVNRSTGRYPDGADTDSNCEDFHTQAVTTLSTATDAGVTVLKVASVAGFQSGEKVVIGDRENGETVTLGAIGTAGATTLVHEAKEGSNMLRVESVAGFSTGQMVSIDDGPLAETATVTSIRRGGEPALMLGAPLRSAHSPGAQTSGSGLTLASALTRSHASGSEVTDDVPTPGAPNQFQAEPAKLRK